jgi:hypothetical protein
MACEAGARRVYAIESDPIIEIARAVAAANGVADRVEFVADVSRLATLPEPADVVLADQIGHFGFEAGLVEDFTDARERFLKPGGRLLPASVELLVAPVESADRYAWVDFWRGRPGGFDFAPVRAWAVNTGYPTRFEPTDLLAPPVAGAAFDLATVTGERLTLEATMTIRRTGTLHGLAGAFSARLSPGVTLSNAPGASPRLPRRNVFFPIDQPVAVAPGDLIDVDMRILPTEGLVVWRVEVAAPDGAVKGRFRHSTLEGMLVRREDLRRQRPDFVPSITPRGEARRSILELCDGHRSLADVERAVFERHPSLFKTLGDASAFVAEVVTGYTR